MSQNLARHLRVGDTVDDILTHPAFGGFARALLPWDDQRYDTSMPLRHIGSLLPYHTHVNPGVVVSSINRIIDEANAGRKVFYDIYADTQKHAEPTRKDTGLFFFRGKPGAPFAVIAPGGGFAYVASLHEGFPHAVEISNRGYNAFVLKYRAGQGGRIATEDLAASLSYILRNAGSLGVATTDYSLWGSSAGARMAAAIGSDGTVQFGGSALPKPSALVLLYTGHSDLASAEPPTFVAVGDADGIATPSVVERRVAALRRVGTDVEYHKYRGVGHGFGLGVGTSAEGWIADALRFWTKQIDRPSGSRRRQRTSSQHDDATHDRKATRRSIFMSQLPASSHFERASARVKNALWAVALSAVLGCAGALAIAQTAPTALVAELADYVEMPRTRIGDGRSQAARINVLIEEPGSGRLFVAEHAGPLSIIDKATRQAVTYINFNGSAGSPGLFPKFAPGGGFVSGLMGFAFDPDYRRNGVFYTIHLEDPALTVDATPKAGVLPGLDGSRFVATKAIGMPANGQPLTREAVVSEWTDSNIRNATFEGTVREVMRVQQLNSIHPMSDLTFNPTAARGDADWRVLYVSTGDGGTGEQTDVRRLNPQRLDHFGGKIIRIVPDLREHVSTSQVSENGQYRIPNDNPFVSTPGARKEIFAYGMRNPHRMAWDVPTGPGSRASLLAFVIGSNEGSPVRYETIDIISRGANYGYPLREGPEFKPLSPIYGPLSEDMTLPLRISDSVVLDQRVPMQDSALAYRTGVEGLAIANGFVYRGKRWPQLQGAVVFGDITSGRLFYARMADLVAATDGNPTTLAAYTEITTNLPTLVQERLRANPPPPPPAPPGGRAGGPGGGPAGPRPLRIELRIATDEAGEIYILTKSDGLIRRVVNIR